MASFICTLSLFILVLASGYFTVPIPDPLPTHLISPSTDHETTEPPIHLVRSSVHDMESETTSTPMGVPKEPGLHEIRMMGNDKMDESSTSTTERPLSMHSRKIDGMPMESMMKEHILQEPHMMDNDKMGESSTSTTERPLPMHSRKIDGMPIEPMMKDNVPQEPHMTDIDKLSTTPETIPEQHSLITRYNGTESEEEEEKEKETSKRVIKIDETKLETEDEKETHKREKLDGTKLESEKEKESQKREKLELEKEKESQKREKLELEKEKESQKRGMSVESTTIPMSSAVVPELDSLTSTSTKMYPGLLKDEETERTDDEQREKPKKRRPKTDETTTTIPTAYLDQSMLDKLEGVPDNMMKLDENTIPGGVTDFPITTMLTPVKEDKDEGKSKPPRMPLNEGEKSPQSEEEKSDN
jgi:hypothetical protein